MPKKLAVAVSGGVDSVALTILLGEFCKEKKIELLAVTVDHKMREGSAGEALELSKLTPSHNHEIKFFVGHGPIAKGRLS